MIDAFSDFTANNEHNLSLAPSALVDSQGLVVKASASADLLGIAQLGTKLQAAPFSALAGRAFASQVGAEQDSSGFSLVEFRSDSKALVSVKLIGAAQVIDKASGKILDLGADLSGIWKLLLVVAAQTGPVSRAKLAALLWPHDPPQRARINLRELIYRLEAEAQDRWGAAALLESSESHLQLNQELVEVDLQQLMRVKRRIEELQASGQPQRAAALAHLALELLFPAYRASYGASRWPQEIADCADDLRRALDCLIGALLPSKQGIFALTPQLRAVIHSSRSSAVGVIVAGRMARRGRPALARWAFEELYRAEEPDAVAWGHLRQLITEHPAASTSPPANEQQNKKLDGRLSLRLMGGYSLSENGLMLRGQSRAAKLDQLLVLMAAAGPGPVSRAELAVWLWPKGAKDRRANLKQLLRRSQDELQSMKGPVLLIDEKSVVLNRQAVDCDLHRLLDDWRTVALLLDSGLEQQAADFAAKELASVLPCPGGVASFLVGEFPLLRRNAYFAEVALSVMASLAGSGLRTDQLESFWQPVLQATPRTALSSLLALQAYSQAGQLDLAQATYDLHYFPRSRSALTFEEIQLLLSADASSRQ